MNTQEILENIKFNTGVFPREALQEAISKPDEIIPELLDVLKYTTQNLEEIAKNLEDTGYIQHIFALYLLAQFREKHAYPLIVEFFSIPGKRIFDVTGDVITGDLCRILASVSCGDIQYLPSLIENPTIDEYVRSAAIYAFVILMFCGEISRDEVIKYFQYLFREGLEKEYSNIWNSLVINSTKIYPEEVYEEIKKIYEEDLVDNFFVRLRDVEDALTEGKEKTLSKWKGDREYTLITNTIKEMEDWACFKTKKELEERFNKQFNALIKASRKFQHNSNQIKNKKGTQRLAKVKKQEESEDSVKKTETKTPPKIGRNTPCPCGSGKKYKKCCLLEKR